MHKLQTTGFPAGGKLAVIFACAFMLPALAADFYVATPANGGDDSASGAQGAPVSTIATAIAKANAAIVGGETSATIHVGDGTYSENSLKIENPIVIEGNASDRTAVKIGKTGTNVFHIVHADAALRNLTVQNGKALRIQISSKVYAYAHGGNVRLEAGVVTNCVLTSGTGDNDCYGANLYISGGTVVDSLLTGGSSNLAGHGSGAYIAGGVVSRCKITGSRASGNNASWPVKGVGAYLASGVIENCLIMGNTCDRAALYLRGGTAVNCTVAGNTIHYSNESVGVQVETSAASVVNCVIYGNGGTAKTEWGEANGDRFFSCASSVANASGDNWKELSSTWSSCFKDNVDWIPLAGSPMMDAGDNNLYLASYSQTDFAGNDRISPSAGRIDIGCYELDQGTFMCSASLTTYPSILAGETVGFDCSSVGATGTVTYEFDFGDGSANLVTTDTAFTRQFDVAGLFHVRVRAKDGDGPYCDWVDVLQPICVALADIYVSTEGSDANAGTAVAPFKTVARALGSLTNTLSASVTDIGGVTIHVADGTYSENALPKIATAVVVEGNSADRTAVKIGKTGTNVFHIANAGAVLRNLTVQNGKAVRIRVSSNVYSKTHGGNVRLESGIVTNCVLSGGTSDNDCYGANLYISGGMAEDCLLTGATGSAAAHGCSAYIAGGCVSRCIIVDSRANGAMTQYPARGTGAYLSDGVIENCLVSGNTCERATLYLNGGKAVNCTIVNNTSQFTGESAGVYVGNSAASVVGCVIYGNGGTAEREWGNVAANAERLINCAFAAGAEYSGTASTVLNLTDAAFADYANHDYHPAKGGALVNAGMRWSDYLALGATSATDLAGNPRLSGARLDIGCYEIPSNPGIIIIVR